MNVIHTMHDLVDLASESGPLGYEFPRGVLASDGRHLGTLSVFLGNDPQGFIALANTRAGHQ